MTHPAGGSRPNSERRGHGLRRKFEGVLVSVAMGRWARWLAALERSKRDLGGGDARNLEPGDQGERHRVTVLEEGDDQEGVVVGLGVIAHCGEDRHSVAKRATIPVRDGASAVVAGRCSGAVRGW